MTNKEDIIKKRNNTLTQEYSDEYIWSIVRCFLIADLNSLTSEGEHLSPATDECDHNPYECSLCNKSIDD